MNGMNANTGAQLSNSQHLVQSIRDILTTRLGSRIARREYGSLLPELIDQPFNDSTRLQLYAATAMALMRWEPRIRLSRVQISQAGFNGAFTLELDGSTIDQNADQSFTIPLNLGGLA